MALQPMEEKVQEEESTETYSKYYCFACYTHVGYDGSVLPVAWCLKPEQVQGQELALERGCGCGYGREQGWGQGGGSTEDAHPLVLRDVEGVG